ncbi:hypothetical protein Tco_0913631 [Tanacetum coccineum]
MELQHDEALARWSFSKMELQHDEASKRELQHDEASLIRSQGRLYKAQSTTSFRDVKDQLKKYFTSLMRYQ